MMSKALLTGFFFEAHGEMVVQVYMAGMFSTFLLCNGNRKAITIRGEMEKVISEDTQGATKETDGIRRLLLSNH